MFNSKPNILQHTVGVVDVFTDGNMKNCVEKSWIVVFNATLHDAWYTESSSVKADSYLEGFRDINPYKTSKPDPGMSSVCNQLH